MIIKTFELFNSESEYKDYLNNKPQNIKIGQSNKINDIINFMKKYELTELKLFFKMDDDEIESIVIKKGKYILLYENHKQIYNEIELSKISDEYADKLYKTCIKNDSFNINEQLRFSDIENFINILKNYKEKINFTKEMFTQLYQFPEDIENLNNYDFQDILFSTHPESYKIFVDLCFIKPTNNLILHPNILIKYKPLYMEWQILTSAEEFNL